MGRGLVPVRCAECDQPMGPGIAASLPRFEAPGGDHAAMHSMYDSARATPGDSSPPSSPPPIKRPSRWMARVFLFPSAAFVLGLVSWASPSVSTCGMAHPRGVAARMASDGFLVAAACPDRATDIWRFITRDDTEIEGEAAKDAVCQKGAYGPAANDGGSDSTLVEALTTPTSARSVVEDVPTPESAPSVVEDVPIPQSDSLVAEPLEILEEPGAREHSEPPVRPSPEEINLNRLRNYTLDLINKDRLDHDVPPVALGINTAAQAHAEGVLRNFYISHWDTSGNKPCMQYTLAGGQGFVAENIAYTGGFDPPEDLSRYRNLDLLGTVEDHEYGMMYDDAHTNWGHRDNIITADHQLMNLGIAYDGKRVAFAQHFQQQWIDFSQLPTLSRSRLTLSGDADTETGAVRGISIFHDEPPEPLTGLELGQKPKFDSIGPGEPILSVLPPPPPGSFCPDLDSSTVFAETWETQGNGFIIVASVGPLGLMPGVYTIILWAEELTGPLTRYSIFVE